jgi:hypothetical protein
MRRPGTTAEGFPIGMSRFPIEMRRPGTTAEGMGGLRRRLLNMRRRPERHPEGSGTSGIPIAGTEPSESEAE